jgi:hypothetical protein
MGRSESAEVVCGLLEVEMLVDGKLCAGETEGVDETGVNKTIRDDEVGRTGKGGDCANVRLVAGGKEDGGGKVEEGGELHLKGLVVGKGSGDKA